MCGYLVGDGTSGIVCSHCKILASSPGHSQLFNVAHRKMDTRYNCHSKPMRDFFLLLLGNMKNLQPSKSLQVTKLLSHLLLTNQI